MRSLSERFPFRILNIERSTLDSQWDYKDVCSPFFRMFYILNGEGYIYHDKQEYSLTPNKLVLIPNYTNCSYFCDNHLEMIYIIFINQINNEIGMYNFHDHVYLVDAENWDKPLFNRLLGLNPNMGLCNYDPQNYDNWDYLDKFRQNEPKIYSPAMLESQGIMLQLFSKFKPPRQESMILYDSSYIRIFQIIQYINKNLTKKLTVNLLAKKTCLSPDYFSRIFLQVTKLRPIEFIQRKRIEKVQLLLATTNYSLEKISEITGLNNASYLTRLFKRYTGTVPGKYRLSQFYDSPHPIK